MITIWKYPLSPRFLTYRLLVPEGGSVVLFACQNRIPTLWIQVDSEGPMVERWFRLFATGEALRSSNPVVRVGSCLDEYANLVFHCFEEDHS